MPPHSHATDMACAMLMALRLHCFAM
jgi:hypothetical protein